MSWASDKAREVVESALPGFNADEPSLTLVRAVERAIRETINRCAQEVDDSMTVEGAAEHVRALADDKAEVGSVHRVGPAFEAPIVEVDPAQYEDTSSAFAAFSVASPAVPGAAFRPHYINGSDSCLVCGETFPPGSSTTGSCPGRWIRR